jgi:hypothetical protein
MLNNIKTNLIDEVCSDSSIKTIVDLGGIWGVDGAYTFYTLEKYPILKACIIDTDITDETRKKAELFPQLTLLSANFGENKIVDSLQKVDMILAFDILLHQVSPHWNKILEMYSKITKYFCIFNPQWRQSDTVRLIDLGVEEYFKNVPHTRDEEPYKSFIEKMFLVHPQHNKLYRDIHNVWQWGITDNDLINTMENFGFKNIYHENYGQWGNLENFENGAFIFEKVL